MRKSGVEGLVLDYCLQNLFRHGTSLGGKAAAERRRFKHKETSRASVVVFFFLQIR